MTGGAAPDLPPAGTPQRLGDAELRRLLATAHDLEANRHAANTRKAYRSDFAHFTAWCSWAGLPALPTESQTVYLYLSALVESGNAADWAISTLDRRLAAIAWVHETAGHLSPTAHVRVRELMVGIRRTHGRPAAKADALTTDQLRRMIDILDLNSLSGLRDRALLLVGFAGAFHRSELVAIDLVDLSRRGDGYVAHLLHTKDDQEGHGRQVGLPAFSGTALCPVAALDAWLTAARLHAGPVFRRVTRYQTVGRARLSPATVNEIVKRTARAAGLPAHRLSGHSLRAGHATTQRSTAPPTARSCARPATGSWRPSRATSAPGTSSATTAPDASPWTCATPNREAAFDTPTPNSWKPEGAGSSCTRGTCRESASGCRPRIFWLRAATLRENW